MQPIFYLCKNHSLSNLKDLSQFMIYIFLVKVFIYNYGMEFKSDNDSFNNR